VLTLPVVVHAVALPVTCALHNGLPWADWLTRQDDGLFYPPVARGWGPLTTLGLVTRVLVNAGVGLLTVAVLAAFEEIGWRAWMLPRLVERLGERAGSVASAGIWALWHVPYVVSGVHHLDNVSVSQLLLLLPLGHLGSGIFLAFLWLRTRSMVLVALAHGSLNNWGQYAFKFMTAEARYDAIILASVNVALLATGMALLPLLAPGRRGDGRA
jgi:membrane protease YdiL (CAAX protease family)